MYSEYSLKDVVRCHLCENPVPPLYCDICDKYLCKACDEKHLSNESIEHKVVPFNRRRSTRKCQNHSSKMCTFFCEQCDCYMCEQCASSEDHKRHKFYSTSDRPFTDVPQVIADIEIGLFSVFSVSCLRDNELWTCDYDSILRLYNLEGKQGKLLKSIETKSRNMPYDLAVTRSGDLVYADYKDRTVSIVKNDCIQDVITLKDWNPRSICCTSSDDFLVVMDKVDFTQTKVVRYSGSAEKQSIINNEREEPLYSAARSPKYITENRNLDVCVSDNFAMAVVVVNHAGIFRFTYTGLTYTGPSSTAQKTFYPLGITTDSQSRILIADSFKHSIHILDQDGQFLRVIDKLNLLGPWGLCVDRRNNLFVADRDNSKIKIIKYYK